MAVVTGDDELDMELLRDKPTLFRERLSQFLTDDEILRVLEDIAGICNHCWDADAGCQCWNDE